MPFQAEQQGGLKKAMDTAWIIGNMLGENANFIINILEPESINNIIAMLVEYCGGTSLETIVDFVNKVLEDFLELVATS